MDALEALKDRLSYRYRRLRHWPGNRRMVRDYFRSADLPKLQIGCGKNALPGWLNTDLRAAAGILRLDATRPLPFANNSFVCVFNEHMLEHIPYAESMKLLGEIFRVLRPEGRVRIATPDLAFLFELYRDGSSALHRNYVDWSANLFCKGMPTDKVTVINNFFRDWGHRYIHDFSSLESALNGLGFVDVTRYAPGESDCVDLRNLEKHGSIIGEDFNRLETLVVEARKPTH
ncbi:MAG TPA: methyltransferase domain-containing protein [Candidatus Saccharimonadales bacterium]|nr:methyltransferase domain-containing protein [Candidatus Saccharimonadales bacterium]